MGATSSTKKLFDHDVYSLLLLIAARENNLDRAIEIHNEILKNIEKVDLNIRFLTYKQLTSKTLRKHKTFEKYFHEYKKLIVSPAIQIGVEDISLFVIVIADYSEKKRYQEAIELCKIMESKFVNLSHELEYETSIIYYWFANLYLYQRENTGSNFYANKCLKTIQRSNLKRTSIINEEGIKRIISQMKNVRFVTQPRQPIQKTSSYGRNQKVKVKYKDGRLVERKYKQVEKDFLSGNCIIID